MTDNAALAARRVSTGFATQREHQLRVTAWCAVANVTLTLAAVVLDEEGEMRPAVYTLLPTSNRVATVQTFTIEAGLITALQVLASAGTPIGAQCYVRVELVQGQSASANTSVGTVCEGYVTGNVPLVYPQASARAVDGHGTFRAIVGTVPAAGAEFVDTVPANTRWALYAASFSLVTGVAVANRLPVLTIDDGANVLWESSNNAAVTASLTAKFRAGAGVPQSTLQTNVFAIPLPGVLLLPAGSRVRSVTAALQAGDQYNAIIYNVEEWLDV